MVKESCDYKWTNFGNEAGTNMVRWGEEYTNQVAENGHSPSPTFLPHITIHMNENFSLFDKIWLERYCHTKKKNQHAQCCL